VQRFRLIAHAPSHGRRWVTSSSPGVKRRQISRVSFRGSKLESATEEIVEGSGSMRAFRGERFSVSQRVAGGPKGDRRREGAGVGIMHWIRRKCTLGANWPGFPRFVLHLSLERAATSFPDIPRDDARVRYHGHGGEFSLLRRRRRTNAARASLNSPNITLNSSNDDAGQRRFMPPMAVSSREFRVFVKCPAEEREEIMCIFNEVIEISLIRFLNRRSIISSKRSKQERCARLFLTSVAFVYSSAKLKIKTFVIPFDGCVRTFAFRRWNIIPCRSRNDDRGRKKIERFAMFFRRLTLGAYSPAEAETKYSNHLVTVYRIVYKGWATINRPRRTPASIIQRLCSWHTCVCSPTEIRGTSLSRSLTLD